MTNAKDKSSGAESMSFEATEVGALDAGPQPAESRKPVNINVAVGDKVKIKAIVIEVSKDSVTLDVDDGIDGNVHRVTLNSNQAAHALK